jgi:hypothetical protein
MRRLHLLTLALAASATGLGCGSTGPADLVQDEALDPAALTILPRVTTLGGGSSIRLTANLQNADGSTTAPTGVAWRTTDAAIASVDGTGLVHGLSAGRVEILASWGDSRGSSLVTVLEERKTKPAPECFETSTTEAAATIPNTDGCK